MKSRPKACEDEKRELCAAARQPYPSPVPFVRNILTRAFGESIGMWSTEMISA